MYNIFIFLILIFRPFDKVAYVFNKIQVEKVREEKKKHKRKIRN